MFNDGKGLIGVYPVNRHTRRKRIADSLKPAPELSEHAECKLFMRYARQDNMLKEYLIKNVNEGERNEWAARALMHIGMRPGLPDYHFPVPNETYHGLWIEMKRQSLRGRKMPEHQDEWIEKLRKIGHYASYAYGADDAIEIYVNYIKNRL